MPDALTAWRIVKRPFADTAFSGEGARRYGGRWNAVGTPVAYAAESRALAALEMLVHLDEAARLAAFVLVEVSFPARCVETIPSEALPAGWNRLVASSETRAFGSRWAREARALVLRVPSALVPEEFNYVVNPRHPDATALLSIGAAQAFAFDPRLGGAAPAGA